MRSLAAILVAILAAACTAVGYPATSDPYRKLDQAEALVRDDRLLMAETIIGEAMALFERDGNKRGMADAYHAYGNLYKNTLYQQSRYAQVFKERGTWDGTYTKSIGNFTKAKDLFAQSGDDVGVAKSFMGMGNGYSLRGENQSACAAYQSALAAYGNSKASVTPLNEPQNYSGYPNLGALIEAFIAKDSCGT